MTFDPTSVEVTCVTLPKDHCVQVPWKYINVCGYSDQFCKIPHTYIHTTYILRTEWVITVSFWTKFRRDNYKYHSSYAMWMQKDQIYIFVILQEKPFCGQIYILSCQLRPFYIHMTIYINIWMKGTLVIYCIGGPFSRKNFWPIVLHKKLPDKYFSVLNVHFRYTYLLRFQSSKSDWQDHLVQRFLELDPTPFWS